MRLALAIASAVILIIHGLVFYDQFFHTWERNQTAYFDQAGTRAQSDQERADLARRRPHIEQIMVTQVGEVRVDRCTTCHIAADDPRFHDHFQPLQTHSYSEAMGDRHVNGRWERRHKFADLGCTVCHDGQGRGLEPRYAHGEDHSWPAPMLGYVTQGNWNRAYAAKLRGPEFMEAACAQCHTEENFAGTPHLARGRQLFFAKGCYGCHRIEGISDGTLGPDLSDVGRRFKLDYIWESIVDPRANIATSFMPQFQMPESDVKALAIFLKSRRGINFNETQLERYRHQLAGAAPVAAASAPATLLPAAEQVKQGERLVRERACTACHKLGDIDGGIAPDLSHEGLIRDADWITGHFRDPRAYVPGSIMPAFRTAPGEFESMTAYLVSLKTPPPAMSSAQTYTAFCARCHGDKGDGLGPLAAYLDPAPREFTRPAFMNSKPLERFEASIRNGVPGTSMPAWEHVLDDASRRAVLDYVFATFVKEPRRELKDRNVPAANPVALNDESIQRGEQMYLRRCTGCHGRKADGKGPNSLDIVPRPRNLRDRRFVDSVTDQRLLESVLYGVQGTAMPPWIDYGLTNDDAGDLVNYIRTVNQGR